MSDWREQAICRGTDPDLFFPDNRYGRGDVQVRAAKQLCKTCPVVAECLADAFDEQDAHAIRGGLTPEERHQVQPRMRATGGPVGKPCGTEAAAKRHRDHREPVDDLCLAAERRARNERARRNYRAKKVGAA